MPQKCMKIAINKAAGIIRDFAGRKIADINTWGKNQQHLYNSQISTTKKVATIYN